MGGQVIIMLLYTLKKILWACLNKAPADNGTVQSGIHLREDEYILNSWWLFGNLSFISSLRTLSSTSLPAQILLSVNKAVTRKGQRLISFSMPLIFFRDTATSFATALLHPPFSARVRMPWSLRMEKGWETRNRFALVILLGWDSTTCFFSKTL